MLVVMDWISSPLTVIDGLFADGADIGTSKISQYFLQKFEEDQEAIWKMPSLNDSRTETLAPNSLVRFRCMVQDIFNPELCVTSYSITNKLSGEKQMRVGLYRDVIDCPAGYELTDNLESESMHPIDRLALYCVPIPGEAQWVKDTYRNMSSRSHIHVGQASGSSTGGSSKRSLDDDNKNHDDNESGSTNDLFSDICSDKSSSAVDLGSAKRVKHENGNNDKEKEKQPDLNFPLPGEKGPACLVKVYDSSADIKVNDIIEFIGILSVDPAMASFDDENGELDALADVTSALRCSDEERAALNPPPSLVPRLHAVCVRPLLHNNPLVPLQTENIITHYQQNISAVREQILSVLEMALFGDTLAAEYLLCHLVSYVYSRLNVVALGKFCLNMTRCSRGYAQHLYQLLSKLVTKSHFLPLSLSNMNNLRFVPHKDYTANKLVTGLLQLSPKTHLVLDETALEAGKLEATGVSNMTALGNVINWQKVDYDFSYHQQSFPADIITLIISEGKSLLKSDCQLPLVPNSTTGSGQMTEIFGGINDYLTPALLSQIRSYLTGAKHLEYSLDDVLQKKVEEDFVEMRREDIDSMSVDDFHSLLTLARLLSLTFGHSRLTVETWQAAKEMEANRKLRLKAAAGRS